MIHPYLRAGLSQKGNLLICTFYIYNDMLELTVYYASQLLQ